MAEIIPFNRTRWTEGSYEAWCHINSFDECETNDPRYEEYHQWAESCGIKPFWEIPF